MVAEPSTIYFSTQLRLLPVEEMRFGKSFVRDLYSRLAEPGGYAYENLSLQSDPPLLSTQRTTPRGEGTSCCRIRSDSITIEETNPEFGVDGFRDVVRTILKAAAEVNKHTPPIFAQKCVFRCIVKPKSANSILLLAGKVSNVLSAIAPFERPPMYFGIRFRFPPVELESEENGDEESESEQLHNFVTVRFETWSKDVDLVWIETDAMYFFQDPIDLKAFDRIEDSITDAHAFLTEKCLNFLTQFDELPDPRSSDDEEEEEPEE